tara:strand:- start:1702 stop:3468 length:1767 start_codon:yes stop_codon:yes gene_type:complete
MSLIQNKFIAKVAIHQIFKDKNVNSQQIVDKSKQRLLKLLRNILKKNPSFGVFTTIDRSPEIKKQAGTDLVHGCHGTFGDGDYKALTAEEMLNHILDKVYSSAHSDSRKNQFDTPLKDDSNGYLKIALLKLPLYEIDYASGRISELNNQVFKNDKLGFIMDKNGNKATYLPDVFPDKSWQEIRDHLVQQKAGTSLDNNIKFFAYKTFDIKSTIGEALKLNLSNLNMILNKQINSKKKINHFPKLKGKTKKLKIKNIYPQLNNLINLINKEQLQNIYQFFKDNYKKDIPYEVNELSSNNTNISVRTSPTDYVRNYASYSDILKLLKLLKKPTTDILYNKVKNSLLKASKSFTPESRQAYPFLIISMYQMNKDGQFTNFINKIEKMLYNDLQNMETSNIDMNFELGEIMMGLCKTFTNNKNLNSKGKDNRKQILRSIHKKMYLDIKSLGYKSNDIFRYNWHCQTVCQYYNVFKRDFSKDTRHKSLFLQHILILKKYLNMYVEKNVSRLFELETNFLAVTFEAYAGLINVMKKENININQKIISNLKKIKQVLDTRFTNYGLFKFNSGSSRIDITGHIVNGLFNLIIINNN